MAQLVLLSSAQAADNAVFTRYYTSTLPYRSICNNLVLKGSILHIAKLKYWLRQIETVPFGREVMQDILDSGHRLTIRHEDYARISAGRTLAPMTENLINGIGEDVEIIFDVTVTDQGSHLVYNSRQELIEYTAVENLFHELVHAKHEMKGTWRYFDSEEQAIEEENVFRAELADAAGTPSTERYLQNGVPIETVVSSEHLIRRTYPVRSNPPYHLAGIDF